MLAVEVQAAVGVHDSAGSGTFGLPLELPSDELGAGGPFRVGTVDVLADQDLPAQRVGQVPLEIHLLRRESILGGVQLDKGGSEAPRVSAVDVASVGHRRRDISRTFAGGVIPP